MAQVVPTGIVPSSVVPTGIVHERYRLSLPIQSGTMNYLFGFGWCCWLVAFWIWVVVLLGKHGGYNVYYLTNIFVCKYSKQQFMQQK